MEAMSSGLTLYAARTTLPSVVFTPGQSASAALAAPPINAATSWLLSEGRWRGTKQAMALTVYDDQITLPREALCVLSAIVQGTGDNFRSQARYAVSNMWYQWIPNGPGVVVNPPYDVSQFTDRGDGYVTFRPLPSDGVLKLYNSTTESAGTVNIRGYDSTGAKVFTGTGASRIEGENLAQPTTASTSSTTSTTWNAGDSLYAIVKPATNGVMSLYHVASGGTETLIATFEPGETIPNYRRYYVPQRREDGTDQVVALVKRKHVDVRADNDMILPGNLRALELAMMAVNFQRKSELKLANDYIANAIKELNAELEDFDSEQSYGVAQLDRFQSMGSVPNLV
jgi:hypothetical protein